MDIRNKDIKEGKDIKNNKSLLGAVSAIMGIASAGYGIYSSIKNQGRDEELMNLQHDLNLDTFDKTGYSAQVNQMRNAGLNPALMYGMGSGGNPEIGNSSISNKDEDVKLAKMAMGLQAMDLASQVKYRESEADLNVAKADEIRGIDKELKETTSKLNESITSLNTATEKLNNLKFELEKAKTKAEINKMSEEVANIIADTSLKQFELNFMQETADDNKKKLREEVNKLIFEQLRIQSQIIVDESIANLNYKKVEELNFKMNELFKLELEKLNLDKDKYNLDKDKHILEKDKFSLESNKFDFESDKFEKEFSLNFQKFYMETLIQDNKGGWVPSRIWRNIDLTNSSGDINDAEFLFNSIKENVFDEMQKNTTDDDTSKFNKYWKNFGSKKVKINQ